MPTAPPSHPSLLSAALLAALLLVPVTADATVDPSTWGERVEKSDSLLRQGEYAAAYEITGPLLDGLGGTLQPDERSRTTLGAILALHALAEAGTGDTESALWHWHFAQSLKQDLRTLDLSPYGEAGVPLAPHRFAADGMETCIAEEHKGEEQSGPFFVDEEDVTPPLKIHAPAPQYSREAREAGLTGRVVIRTIIDRDGRIQAPYLAYADEPSLAFLASEAMRQWRFLPAFRKGKPVDVYYNLTVNFTLEDPRSYRRRSGWDPR